MSTIEALKRVLGQLRAGEQPAEADLLVLGQAVDRLEARKGTARRPGRPKGAKNRDLSPNSEHEQMRIDRVMNFLSLVDSGMKVGDASTAVANGSRTLDRDRKKYGKLARYFLEEDAAFEAIAEEMKGIERPDASEEFGQREHTAKRQ